MCARTKLTLGLAWSKAWSSARDSEKKFNTLRLSQKPRKSDRQDRGVLIRTLKGNPISKHRQENADFCERTLSLVPSAFPGWKIMTEKEC